MKHANAIVGQSGGPTAAINATLAGVIAGAAASAEVDKLYGMRNGIEGLLADRVVDLSCYFGDETVLSLLKQTPAAALGSCRKKLPPVDDPAGGEVYETLFAILERYDIGFFFYIGGNDSMDSVAKLTAYAKVNGKEDIVFIGLPKTIDNDLCGTDHTPGFGSAAKYIATVMLEILRDTAVYTLPAVTLVEIMGRDAGWLTASAALPRIIADTGPDLVYLPEVPFSLEGFFADVRQALSRHNNVVIALSEGIRFSDGRYVGEGVQSGVCDAFGHRYLAGAGKALEIALRQELGCKVRSLELSLPQRCAGHLLSATDIQESFEAGRYALRFSRQCAGKMVCFERTDAPYHISCTAREIVSIANKIKKVPQTMIAPSGNQVTDECLAYLRPLIDGEVRLEWENGLPKHFVLP